MQPLHLTNRQEEEEEEEEVGLATLPRRTGLLVGRRRIRSRTLAEGEDAEDVEAKAWWRQVRWAQPPPVLATSAASREREASERAIDSSWANRWELLVEDSEGELLALLLTLTLTPTPTPTPTPSHFI